MHNTYVLSLRTKGSLPFSINDYSSLLNERFCNSTLQSSCCCSCCCCCASNRVSVNPSYLYGLRQSTLIRCAPSRRLILRGKVRVFNGFGLDCDRFEEVSSSIRWGGSVGNRRKSRFECMVKDEGREKYIANRVDEAEAIINLLSKEISESCFRDREKNEILVKRVDSEKYGKKKKKKRVDTEKRQSYGDESREGRKRIVEIEDRGDYGRYRHKENKSGGVVSLGKDLKREYKLVSAESSDQGYRRNVGNEEREGIDDNGALNRGEIHRGRRKNSSCSSYYSVSSSRDFENDLEFEDNEERFVEEESSSGNKVSRRNEEGKIVRQVAGEKKRHSEDDIEHHGEVSKEMHTTAGSNVQWDCRKTSEKKLTEEQKYSAEKSSQTQWKIAVASESDFGMASSSHKKFVDEEDNSRLLVNFDKEERKQYTTEQVTGQSQSRRRYQQANVSENYETNVERTSQSNAQLRERADNSNVRQRVSQTAEKDDFRIKSQVLAEESETRVSSERDSHLHRHHESRVKTREDNTTTILSSAQRIKEQHHQTGLSISGQVDERRSENISKLSERTSDNNTKRTSILQSETRRKKFEDTSVGASGSRTEVGEQGSRTYEKPLARVESRKGSQNITNVSVVRVTDIERVRESERVSETRSVNQENIPTSPAKLIVEIRNTDNQTGERIEQRQPQKQATEHFDTGAKSERSSNAILMPRSSQPVDRSSTHYISSTGMATEEVSHQTLESSSGASYTRGGGRTPVLDVELHGRHHNEADDGSLNLATKEGVLGPAHRLGVLGSAHRLGVLGSAHRFEESSTKFVNEFVEKATDEGSGTKVVHEGEKHRKKSSELYGSKSFPSKDRDSRRSSKRKGPTDEMWDVTDPSVQETTTAVVPPEAAEETDGTMSKRTGRSLWRVIGDVVRLPWGSRGESRNSATRSGGKGTTMESGSEGWFSGHEPDETSDENAKKESSIQEATSSQQAETSDRIVSTHVESGTASIEISSITGDENLDRSKEGKVFQGYSSSTKVVAPSAPLRVTSLRSSPVIEEMPDSVMPAGDENLDRSQVGRVFQGYVSSTEIATPPVPLHMTSLISSPVIAKITGATTPDVYVSGSTVQQVKQPVSTRLTASSSSGFQGKDGELKQRKLQRNPQVPRDKFDEWEDAYKLESEQRKIDETFMREALLEAKKAGDSWEVPVGAVLVHNGTIIARGCNLVEELRDSTAHAEMICIREASNVLRSWRLANTTLYVTLEPCPMCAGAILQARIGTLVWGAPNKLLGADGSWIRLFPGGGEGSSEQSDKPPAPVHPFHPNMKIRRGILAPECADAMNQFFQLRRKKNEKKDDDPPPQPSCLPITNHPSKILTKVHDMFHLTFCL